MSRNATCGFDRRVQRPVHGDQVVAADELVQLDVVHVTALAELRCVQHGEHVVGVDVDLGHVVALDAIAHRDPVEAEHLRQHLDGDLVARRDVDPDDGVLTVQQPRQLHDVVPLDAGIADHQHIHLRHPPFRAQQRSRTPRKRVGGGNQNNRINGRAASRNGPESGRSHRSAPGRERVVRFEINAGMPTIRLLATIPTSVRPPARPRRVSPALHRVPRVRTTSRFSGSAAWKAPTRAPTARRPTPPMGRSAGENGFEGSSRGGLRGRAGRRVEGGERRGRGSPLTVRYTPTENSKTATGRALRAGHHRRDRLAQGSANSPSVAGWAISCAGTA